MEEDVPTPFTPLREGGDKQNIMYCNNEGEREKVAAATQKEQSNDN